VQSFANSILESKNLFSFKAKTYITLIVLGTVLGFFLSKKFGSLGLITGTTSGWILSQIIMNFYYKNVLQLNVFRFFKELANKLVPTFLLILILGWLLNFLPGNNWFNLVVKISIFVSIFSLLMFRFGMNQEERQTISSMLPKFLKAK